MGALLQDGLADGTVGRNITLTLTMTDPRKTMLARASTIYKDRPVLSSERAPHKDRNVTVKE
jgi:hypothetical protein